jgi:ankyrin repeat protein
MVRNSFCVFQLICISIWFDIQHGALLEERDQDQFTALMLAIQATHGESAQLLLEYGANPNVR